MYTQAQLTSIHLARNRLLQTGKPEVWNVVANLLEQEAPYDEIWKVANADVEKMVKPEKVGAIVPLPPFRGPGSTRVAWQDFARKVSDMDPDVIITLGRDDIITILVDKGIIEGPDYELMPAGLTGHG